MKAQTDMAYAIATIIALLIIAPFIIKAVMMTTEQFSNSINQTSPQSAENIKSIQTKFLNFADYVVILFVFFLFIGLFVFSFLVDTHPLFFIFYILTAGLLFIILPSLQNAVEKIYSSPQLSDAVANMPITSFFLSHLLIFIIGGIFISLIIIYAKIRGGGSEI